jgi:hypothetical protein
MSVLFGLSKLHLAPVPCEITVGAFHCIRHRSRLLVRCTRVQPFPCMSHANAKTPCGEFRDGGTFAASDRTAQGNERDARIARKLGQRNYAIFVGRQNCLVVIHGGTPNANRINCGSNIDSPDSCKIAQGTIRFFRQLLPIVIHRKIMRRCGSQAAP